MAKLESPLETLRQYLPEGSFDAVMDYFIKFPIHLTLTQARKTRLGDYRSPAPGKHFHQISVNGTLNRYSFLITLLHEIAHLTTFVIYKHKVAPHGPEWKNQFKTILNPFLGKEIFPIELEIVIRKYIKDPAASTCADPDLFKALRKFDGHGKEFVHVEDLEQGAVFELDERRFQKLDQLRKRARCKDLVNGRLYFIQGIAMVRKVIQPKASI